MAIILDVVSNYDIVKRAKVMLAKNFGINASTKKPWTPNSNIRIMKKNQSNGTKNMKNINFVPKDAQIILSSDKISESIMSRKSSLKKLFLIISRYSQENTCVGGISFLIKMSFNKRPTTLSKRDSNAGVFLVVLTNF